MDKRTKKVLKRYLHFYKLPGFLEKKWKKKSIELINEYFSTYDHLQESIGIKDENWESLSIDDLIDILVKIAEQFESAGNELSLENESIDNALTAMKSDMDIYCLDLQAVIDEQNDYEWYTPATYAFIAGNVLYLGYGNCPDIGDYYGGEVVTKAWKDFDASVSAPWSNYKDEIAQVKTLSSFTQASISYADGWFSNCAVLTVIDLTYFNSRGVISAVNFINNCVKLQSVTIGQYCDLFARFNDAVTIRDWYTLTALVDQEYLYGCEYPATYYTTSPLTTVNIVITGLADEYEGEIAVILTMSDMQTYSAVISSETEYQMTIYVAMYNEREENYVADVTPETIKGYEEAEVTIDGLTVTIKYEAIEALMYLYCSDTLTGVIIELNDVEIGDVCGDYGTVSSIYDNLDDWCADEMHAQIQKFIIDDSCANKVSVSVTKIFTDADSLVYADFRTPGTYSYTRYDDPALTSTYVYAIFTTSLGTSDEYCRVLGLTDLYKNLYDKASTISSTFYTKDDRSYYISTDDDFWFFYYYNSIGPEGLFYITSDVDIHVENLYGTVSKVKSFNAGRDLYVEGNYYGLSGTSRFTASETIYINCIHDISTTSSVYFNAPTVVFNVTANYLSGNSVCVQILENCEKIYLNAFTTLNSVYLNGVSHDVYIYIDNDEHEIIGSGETCFLQVGGSISSYNRIIDMSEITYLETGGVKNFTSTQNLNVKTIYLNPNLEINDFSYEEGNEFLANGFSTVIGGNGTIYSGPEISWLHVDSQENPGYGTLKES